MYTNAGDDAGQLNGWHPPVAWNTHWNYIRRTMITNVDQLAILYHHAEDRGPNKWMAIFGSLNHALELRSLYHDYMKIGSTPVAISHSSDNSLNNQ